MSSSKPKVAGRAPMAVEVEAGKDYYYCRCGHSKNQPWCDGSHTKVEGGFTPLKFTAEETKKAYLCMCRRSRNQPFCDGSHTKLPDNIKDIEDILEDDAEVDLMQAGPTKEEPTLAEVKMLAREGKAGIGHHGPMDAMGVPRDTLPHWNDIQFVVAQLATKPLAENVPVSTKVVIGPTAKKPLVLDCPIFVSDMSYGALSEEAKVALAKGTEMAGTGICSGEGGMLPEEQQANSKYFYELASAKFGFHFDLLKKVQAFHFKGGQGAKTGTGGHLPGTKVVGKVAKVRELEEGVDAISPPSFPDLHTVEDFKAFAEKCRSVTGGVPIGFKISAQHIERDIDFALRASADYIILDGRGGATGAAPKIFRDHISVPTIPALARARRYLDSVNSKCTLIVTGGLRLPADFIKTLCLGADAVAISNSALQSIGCVAARICNTGLCPASIATQDPTSRAKLDVEKAAKQLCNFLEASTHLMTVIARACGHDKLSDFNQQDIVTWKKEMHELTGIHYAGHSFAPLN